MYDSRGSERKGMVIERMSREWIGTVVLLAAALTAACAPPDADGRDAEEVAVRPGIDVLLDEGIPAELHGARAGLVTNQTGVDAAGRTTIDRLAEAEEVDLVALFSPEHGIRGTAAPGELVDHSLDERTGLPIHSLYGDTRRPTPEMLEGVDVLLFDIQDVGARPYTYIYTMALAMEAAAEHGLPIFVLDRPNPIGDEVEGGLLDPDFATFVGMYPIPMRHGMTAGELAQMFNEDFGIDADLTVVPVEGWRREMWGDETGLPWIAPSPNLPRLEAAVHYPGTVLFEGTNLSAGRGSSHPFEQVGAPWLRAEEVVREMRAMELPGVEFEPVSFTPENPGDAKFDGVPLEGVRLRYTDRDRYLPVETSIRLIDAIYRLHPGEVEWHVSHLDRLAGTDALRLEIEGGGIPDLLADWAEEAAAFRETRQPFLLYP
jgi:uncharacterized protein YbbC (DUF1343 family)